MQCGEEFVGGVRLRKNRANRSAVFSRDTVVLGVLDKTADGDDPNIGTDAAQGVNRRRSVHDGHHHIEKHDLNIRLVRGVTRDRFRSVAGVDDAISVGLECDLRDIPHGNNVPRLTARGARRWLVLHASHLASTSGSQIAVITEPASRAELEPVIASRPGPFPGRCR